MSRPTNIFELLSDENDSEVKKVVTQQTPSKQQTKVNNSNPPPKKSEQKNDRITEGKVGDTRARNDKKTFSRNGASTEQISERQKNRPPRQQRNGVQRERSEGTQERQGSRQYDRRSGTGRGKEIKRGGGGRGNWGSIEDEQKAQIENPPIELKSEEQKTEPVENVETKAETSETQPIEKQPEIEDEDAKLRTLDDYLKQIKAPTLTLPPPRVVEDTEGRWDKLVPLKREEEQKPQKKESKKSSEKEETTKNLASQLLKFSTPPSQSPKDRSFGRGERRNSPKQVPRGPKRSNPKNVPAPNFP